MNRLVWVLKIKIAVTVFMWCLPLLFFPVSVLEGMGFVVPQPILFLKLLGMAYAALGVGYYFGWRQAREGFRPAGVIWAGIISNGGACLLLAYFGFQGLWATWKPCAWILMWASLLATFAITLGLILFGLRAPQRAKDGLG